MYRLLITITLLITIACSCRREAAIEPLKFTGYEHNPILIPGPQGSFDDMATLMPYVFFHEGVYYLFYSGWSQVPVIAGIGIATSTDGYHFTKYAGNPILIPSETGFDTYGIGSSIVLKDDSMWVMYYNAGDIAIYIPGAFIGRATAQEPKGPWSRSERPVMMRGHKSEWDGGYILPNSILKLENGRYLMYYTAGTEFANRDFGIGMATSADGITWIKYNDPTTIDHPYADSDPVMTHDFEKNMMIDFPWSAAVYKTSNGFEMYYAGEDIISGEVKLVIRYATSPDGIHWERYPGDPVYGQEDDPFSPENPVAIGFEYPSLVRMDSVCFMYFDYDVTIGKIGVAVCPVGGLSR